MPNTIFFTLNGKSVRLEADENRRLLWVLRTELALTGPKPSCARGLCGACTVLVDDRPVRSCMTTVGTVRGRKVVTIEGLARDGVLHPLQKAFIEHDALQCGFCTPGMILTAYGLLREKPRPSREEVIQGMDRNLCRCGAHTRILDAIQSASKDME
ncbi:MAG: (2Fe-2S)-binding protein [Polyangiales bacterium]|jgi:aerobic-type carbon monoxide dehydrogenase small subunit (CoxS/CutS family)